MYVVFHEHMLWPESFDLYPALDRSRPELSASSTKHLSLQVNSKLDHIILIRHIPDQYRAKDNVQNARRGLSVL